MDSQDGTDLRPGLVVAERFRLIRPLAAGGMGTIWVAHHDRLDKDIAVKFIASELVPTPLRLARFEREARAVGKLNSRHVVQIFDCGMDRGRPYIAMELLNGEDLHTRLRRCGRFDLRQTAWLIAQMSKGLRQAHEAGIVHRDLKPANVFLARIDDEEVVKLLDFGVAKIVEGSEDGNNTSTGVVVGSPNYMSPEQSRSSRAIDHRSDLWSLGVIVYRCLTGTHPFHGETATDVIVKICTEPVRPPTMVLPSLPPSVDSFFERALARNPAQRFQSAPEMADAFIRAVSGAWSAGHGDWPGGTPASSPGYGPQPPTSHPSLGTPPGSYPSFTTPGPGSHPSFGTLPPVGSDPWLGAGSGALPPFDPRLAPGVGPAPLAPVEMARGSFVTSPGTLSSLGLVTGPALGRRRTLTVVTAIVGATLVLGAGGLVAWRLGAPSEPAPGSAGSGAAVETGPSRLEDPSAARNGPASPPSATTPPQTGEPDSGPSASAEPSGSAAVAGADGKPASTKGRHHPTGSTTSTPASTGKPSWGF